MTEAYEHTGRSGEPWTIRQVQAIDSDPMFAGARFTCSVESGEVGFEVEVEFAPIYYHVATLRQRRRLPETAVGLVRTALDQGASEATRIRVSSDGVARRDGEVVAALFAPAV